MRNRLTTLLGSPWLRAAFALAVTSLLIYVALKDVDLAEIGIVLRQASPGPLWIALLSVALTVLAKSVRWRLMLSASGNAIPFSTTLLIILMGQALNLFLPGRAGDATRAVVAGKSGAGSAFALGTIALEKGLDLACFWLLFIWMLLLIPMPPWFQDSVYTLTVLVGLLVSSLWLLARFPDQVANISERLVRWLPLRIRATAITSIRSGLASFKIIRQPARMVRLAFWSAVCWATAIWTNQLVFQALHLELPWTAALSLLVALQAGISLPTMFGRIGIFQTICLLVLGLFGISRVVGFSYGLVLQAIVTLPTTLFGLMSIFILGLGKASPRFPPLSSR